jgi:epoxyqueuosine reductase
LSRRARRRAARRARSGAHDPRTYAATLQRLVLDAGAAFVGVTDAEPLLRARGALEARRDAGLADDMHFTYGDPHRATTPREHVSGAQSVLVAALSYADDQPVADVRRDGELHGRVARYAWRDYYGELRDALRVAARQLHRDGYRATVFADDNAMVDREVAYKAGIGWFGKNANLLVPGAGSWFVLGCLVTDAELAPHAAPLDNGCGPCRRCIVACPTQAIVADGVIDARRCLAWIIQKPGSIDRRFRRAIGARMYGCDDCQDVCPPSMRGAQRVTAAQSTATSDRSVALVDLLNGSDDEVVRRVDRWYVAERNPRWVRRNALVVLGNVATPQDRAAVDVVRRYAAGADDLLAEHAQWALAEIDRR